MIRNLNDQLEEYKDDRRNAFISALTINSEGRYIAGIYGTDIPEEILWASDIVPINIYSIDDSNIKAAEEFIEPERCSLIKASYGYAITDKCPFTHLAHIIVGSDMCPDKTSMIKKLGNLKEYYILSQHNNVEALASKYRRFASFLEQKFNLKISDSKLRCAIKKINDISKKMEELSELYMLKPDIISCDDLYSIIYGSQFILDLDERYAKLAETTESIENIKNTSHTPDNGNRKRILITGAPLAGLKEKIIRPLSALDNISVIFSPSCCEGESYQLADESKDPYTALAEKYLSFTTLKDLTGLIVKFKADAVINVRLACCRTLSDICDHLDIPCLSLTTDYSEDDMEEVSKQLNHFICNL